MSTLAASLGHRLSTRAVGVALAFVTACVSGVSVYVNGDNPLFSYAASLENLKRYCERLRAQYFPETLGTSAAKSKHEVAA